MFVAHIKLKVIKNYIVFVFILLYKKLFMIETYATKLSENYNFKLDQAEFLSFKIFHFTLLPLHYIVLVQLYPRSGF